MDNILDRFGIYDFFGLLLPGMFFIVVLIFIGVPQISGFTYPNSEAFLVTTFVLISYICGTIMQEIASFFDDKMIKMRKSARQKYLFDKEFTEIEQKELKLTVNQLLKKSVEYCPTYKEFESIFFICKEHVESKGNMKKADKLDSIFAMSRDFIVCNFLLAIIVFIIMCKFKAFSFYNWVLFASLLISIFLFWRRANRYAKMRVRSIFRRYMACQKANKI